MMGTNVGGIYYEVALDTAQLVRNSRTVQSEVDRAARAFNVITRAVQVYAAALTALKLAEMADDFRLLQARVNVASDTIEDGAKSFEQLRSISTSTRSALEGNVQVFTRLNPSIKQMGGNAQDTLRIVDLLAKAITVSGATAAEKTSAMIQFGQALGSGKLAGDELRSLLENAPYLMKQLADGLGVPIGQLKSLGEQGKLTADVVVNALTKAADKINRDFASFPQTVSSAMTVARDALSRFIAKLDEFAGSTPTVTGIVEGLSKALGTLADMLARTGQAADGAARRDEIQGWATRTAKVLSYVADAADLTWQTLSVLGRNVGFVFSSIGREIGGIGAQVAAVLRGDFKGAAALGDMIKADAAAARAALDAADAETLKDRKLWGQQMREEWARAAAAPTGTTTSAPPSKLKAPVDPEEQRKLAARRAAAQAYYEGLLADAKTGLAKIDGEEQKALQENARRMAADEKNADIYAKAKTAIVAKYARERALLEEQYAQETAAFNIAVTTDEQQRIEMIRAEAFRAADAEVKLGVKTFQQGEQAKRLAAFQAGQAIIDMADRTARARFEGQFATARDTEQRIRLVQEETVRAAELAYARGRITFEEAEAAKVRAARQAEDDLRALRDSRAAFKAGTLELKAGAGGIDDQERLAVARAEQARTDALAQKELGIADEQAYADRIFAINEDLQRRLLVLRAESSASALSSTANAFGQLTEAVRNETGKQDAIFKAAFIAQKAFAIASAIVNIQAGIAQAANVPWPANLAAMASVVASTASIIATIRGTNYGGGRQYGGPVSASSLYRVNESGRPEMFTAANGAQYMLPTRDGKVTSADRVEARESQQRPITVIQNFTVPPGTSLQTQQQMAAAAARGLQVAAARNN